MTPPSNELKQILGEIEERNRRTVSEFPMLTLALEPHLKSELALVKALRRATQVLEILNDGSFPIPRSDISIGIELEQIIAILNQGRAK